MSLPMFSHASKLHFIKKWSKLKGTMFEIFHHLFLEIAQKGVKNVSRMTNDISKLSSGTQLYHNTSIFVPRTPENTNMCLRREDEKHETLKARFLVLPSWRWHIISNFDRKKKFYSS